MPPLQGFEHCVANMFIVPLGMYLGAPITVSTFLTKNLIPATIGNIIGGGFFVATAYGLVYGAWERDITAACAGLWSNLTGSRSRDNKSSSSNSNGVAQQFAVQVPPGSHQRV